MRATISILGLTEFDDSVWENFVVPEEAADHKEDIIEEICTECSDLELLYPDWTIMKRAIGRWSRHELPIWNKLYAAKALTYNPLWNVEEYRLEERSTRDDGEHSTSKSGQDSRTGAKTGTSGETLAENISRSKENEADGTETDVTTTSGTKNGTNSETTGSTKEASQTEKTTGTEDVDTTNKSNSFNSGAMIDNSQQIVDRDTGSNRTLEGEETLSGTKNGTDSETTSGTENKNITTHDEGTESESVDRDQTINRTSKDDETESGTHSETESGTTANLRTDRFEVNRHGNIGVTSSQDLLKQEWEVSQLDPEQFIIDSFKSHFCLMVY